MQKCDMSRSLVFCLMILAATCASFSSCRRLHFKEQPGPRNLIPGLSEELTALATRHRQQWLLIVAPSDNNEEARNLTGLIEKAFETGGWKVVGRLVSDAPIRGLNCTYNREQQKVVDDLVSVFEKKGLAIKCLQRDDPTAFRPIILEVGPKP